MLESNLARVENKAKSTSYLDKVSTGLFPRIYKHCKIVPNHGNHSSYTSPLERSYPKLQLVAAKRRNHFTSENLEVLYLLAAINHLCLPRGATEYDAEIKKLM